MGVEEMETRAIEVGFSGGMLKLLCLRFLWQSLEAAEVMTNEKPSRPGVSSVLASNGS